MVYLKRSKKGIFAAHYSNTGNAERIEKYNLNIQTLDLSDSPYYEGDSKTQKRDIYSGEGEIHKRFKSKLRRLIKFEDPQVKLVEHVE